MPARAQVVPVAIQPFRARCFDDAKLAERVRARLPPDVPVSVGRAPEGAGAAHLVRVTADASGLTVQVTARSASRRVVGSERRVIPEGGDCAGQLEVVALIVARAATPLTTRVAPPPRPPKNEVTQNDPREKVGKNDARDKPGRNEQRPGKNEVGQNDSHENVGQNDAAHPEPREADADEAARRAAAERDRQRELDRRRELDQKRDAELARERARELELVLELERERERNARRDKPQLPPEKISRTGPPPVPPRRFELDLLATWIFPLDGGPSTPTGELISGLSWRRLGFAVRAGVSDEWSATAASSAGPVTLFARRVPLAAELHVDFRVRGGCIRVGAGPLVALWVVSSTNLPHPASRVLADPGLTVRASYRLELAPIVLQLGVTVDFLFRADDLAIGGVGTIAHTPQYQVGPFVSFGFQR